jgi:4-diphosphocytidyl-2-C-methyl-D-erythritol kinase
MATTVRSHAKINLGLGIGAPRADGFHGLTTVYQTLEMHDLVTVEARRAGATTIRLTSNDKRVPLDERNTAWKMVLLVLEKLGIQADVAIHIEKRLPVQGGLGAGSANAVAALVGLESELGIREPAGQQASESAGQQLGISESGNEGTKDQGTKGPRDRELRGRGLREQGSKWLELAAKVGSDVPLFLIGGAVLGVDRGQKVSPLPDFEQVWCVVAVPPVGVSTPQAFRDWDDLCAREGLTAEASAGKLEKLSRAYASAFSGGQGAGSSGVLSMGEDLAGPQGSELVRTGIMSWIENDFERVVFPQQPILCEIKRLLAASGTPEAALYASLSGSGSALYGLYASGEAAKAGCARVAGAMKDVQCTLTRTMPRAAYWAGMIVAEVS